MTNEYDGTLATTFGKASDRHFAAAGVDSTVAAPRAATAQHSGFRPESTFGAGSGGAQRGVSRASGESAAAAPLSSTLRQTPGKHSAWAAPPHHVVFNGTVPLEELPPRAVSALAETRFELPPPKGGASASKRASSSMGSSRLISGVNYSSTGSGRSQVASTPDAVSNVASVTQAVYRCGNLQNHRNCHALTVDGRPVSTFGGVMREASDYATGGSYVRLTPGPGQYAVDPAIFGRKSVGGKGLLCGGRERGAVIMTRSGLIGDVAHSAPVSRAPSRAELESRAAQRLLESFGAAAADETPATTANNSSKAGGRATPKALKLRDEITAAGAAPSHDATESPGHPPVVASGHGVPSSGFINAASLVEYETGSNDGEGGRRSRLTTATHGGAVTTPSVLPIEFNTSHTHNVQLRVQEARRKRILRVPVS